MENPANKAIKYAPFGRRTPACGVRRLWQRYVSRAI